MSDPLTSIRLAKNKMRNSPERLTALAIWEDVLDRRDVGAVFRSIDQETQTQVLEAWEAIAKAVYSEAHNAS